MNAIQILQESYSRVTLIPVIGSGFSCPFQLPDWKTLIEKAASYFRLSAGDMRKLEIYLERYEYVDAVDVILSTGITELQLQKFVSDSMYAAKKKAPAVKNNYEDLSELSRLRYMTTNYDQYINDIMGARTFRMEELETIKLNQFSYSSYDNAVIPLHGEISRPESIVLSRNSYENLYGSDKFHEEFQQLRQHFTFLFMGFSFEDKYVQNLFDKVLQRFEAQHFILFEKSEQINHPDKIQRLRERYGIEALFYDASIEGHTEAISRWIKDIFNLSDPDVDLHDMDKLPKNEEEKLTKQEESLLDCGREMIRKERLGDLYQLYWPEYSSEQFCRHSVKFQIDIICGLLWYYGFQRKEKESFEIMDRALKDPVISAHKNKLSFMYAQLLWNVREFGRGLQVLEEYGEKNPLGRLLYDLLTVYKKFLPERRDVEGNIPVYGSDKRSDEEQEKFNKEYQDLKDKYINPETYNLKNLSDYEDGDSQRIAYYWLGIAAGQLFHQHQEAIQYLLRADELEASMAVCEELAHNYYAAASEEIRYAENPRKYQLDMNSLLKAKIRFQYLMNYSEKDALPSIYERSGFIYLQILFWLKDFPTFYEFYEISGDYIPASQELYFLKAQADAEFEHTVPDADLERLEPGERQMIKYCCVYHRAELFSGLNLLESNRLYREILLHADAEGPVNDKRIVQIVMDAAFFLKDTDYYEKLKKIYPAEYFLEFQQLGFEDELYGRIDEAEVKINEIWSQYKDYDGTFRIIKGFYVRNRKRKEYDKMIQAVMACPPDDMYTRPQFYADIIITELSAWQDTWNALYLFSQYYDRINEDIMIKKELEETLKIHGADYKDYENRIAWNRYVLTKAPKYARYEIYLSILKLYVANSKYKEAAEVLEEMKQNNIPMIGNFDKLIAVCIRPQNKKNYLGIKPYYSSDKEYLNRLLREAGACWRYPVPCFAAEGKEVILPVKYLLCMFRQNRQRELSGISKIHIMYAGLINLHNSLWAREDAFLRMILQWLERADNIVFAAPDFLACCQYAPRQANKEHRAEDIQIQLYSREHPDYICLTVNGGDYEGY